MLIDQNWCRSVGFHEVVNVIAGGEAVPQPQPAEPRDGRQLHHGQPAQTVAARPERQRDQGHPLRRPQGIPFPRAALPLQQPDRTHIQGWTRAVPIPISKHNDSDSSAFFRHVSGILTCAVWDSQ